VRLTKPLGILESQQLFNSSFILQVATRFIATFSAKSELAVTAPPKSSALAEQSYVLGLG
jgi:hypothetical protein